MFKAKNEGRKSETYRSLIASPNSSKVKSIQLSEKDKQNNPVDSLV